MTTEETLYYKEACDAFSDVDKDDAEALAAIENNYSGLKRGDACDWAIYGFTVQDWLTVESQMSEIASYVDQLRAQIRFLKGMIDERQKVVDEQISAFNGIGKKEESTN